jgi:hypothetical protein
LAFARAGYNIKCLTKSNHSDSAYSLLSSIPVVKIEENPDSLPTRPTFLSRQFALENMCAFSRILRMQRPRRPRFTPLQHVPYDVWKSWGEFDDIFSIVRHPAARLQSSLKYHFRNTQDLTEFHNFCQHKLRIAKSKPWGLWSTMGGHLIPQTYFLSKDVQIYKFEKDWKTQICNQFGLEFEDFPVVNVSRPSHPMDEEMILDWAIKNYYCDFKNFEYEP